MYTVVTEKMNDRTRIKIQKLLLEQEKKRPSVYKATQEYFKRFPDQLTLVGKNVLASSISGSTKPKDVWLSQHAQNRMNAGVLASLTKNEINDVIRVGAYLPNRDQEYYNSKHGRWKSNRGRVGPSTPGAKKSCPTRRIATDNKTVVLSFCYPRGIRELPMWYPNVVTVYRKRK
jgi:hypothetical protein